MSAVPRRRAVLTLRTLGRGFWIGLAASLALHLALLSTATFPLFKPPPSPELEVWLEAVEPALPAASGAATRATTQASNAATARPQAASHIAAAPQESIPEPSLAPPPAVAEQTGPVADDSTVPLAPPPAEAGAPSAVQGPHAALTQAADRLAELPAHVEITYELKGRVNGRQIHRWHRDGERYRLNSVAEATGLAGVFLTGRITQSSSGRIGALGLVPERYEMVHLNGRREILQFDYANNAIQASRIDARKGTRSAELPLLSGTQDPLSSLYQLAMLAHTGGEGLIVTAGTKRVKGYRYRVLGREIQQLPLGTLETLHVVRAGEEGSGSVQLWLAPEQHDLPVRISYTDEDGSAWVLQAVSINLQ